MLSPQPASLKEISLPEPSNLKVIGIREFVEANQIEADLDAANPNPVNPNAIAINFSETDPQATKTENPSPEFLDELTAKNQELESAEPIEIIEWAANRFGKSLTFATAFGPEGMVILYFLSKLNTEVHCFNLDTGYQFKETLELREKVARDYGISVELCRPETSVEDYEKQNGKLYLTNPNQCCQDRKIKVLHKAIEGKEGWISAIRRDQSPDRAMAPIVGWDDKFKLVKVNPLANWTKSNIWKTILDNNIPYNPLHDQGFPSIGCEPCTRPVQIGEDERAGRWSGSAKTECGLHSLDK